MITHDLQQESPGNLTLTSVQHCCTHQLRLTQSDLVEHGPMHWIEYAERMLQHLADGTEPTP